MRVLSFSHLSSQFGNHDVGKIHTKDSHQQKFTTFLLAFFYTAYILPLQINPIFLGISQNIMAKYLSSEHIPVV